MTREEIYDSEIAPRMTEIIRVCQENDIPVFASFQLDDERPSEDPLLCTTSIVPKDGAGVLRKATDLVYPEPQMSELVVKHADGSEEIHLLSVIP